MTEQEAPTTAVASERRAPAQGKALLGPLTVRDVAALAGVVVIFVASLLPLLMGPGFAGNLWSLSPLFFLGIGVILPLAVGVLFVVRRLSPEVKLRFGSLSVDQFASVIAAFATFYFFLATVANFRAAYLVGLIGALILLSATVLAPWIPIFAADFAGRAETPAHPVARDAVVAARRPAAPKQALALPAGPGSGGAVGAKGGAAGARAAGERAGQPGQFQGQPGQFQGQGWTAGSQEPGHTPAGQIFTPAGDSPGMPAAGAAAGAVAPVPAGAQAGAADAGASAPSAAQPPAARDDAPETAGPAATGVHATSAQATSAHESVAHETVAQEPGAPAQASANAHEPQAARGTEPAAGVVPPGQGAQESAPATMLNPKIVEPAPAGESIGATVHPQGAPVAADPFWFAVDRPQNVVDEHTRQFVFKLMPGSWILALEDRGSSFLVQDSHGKTGLLLDLVGVERAPEGQ